MVAISTDGHSTNDFEFMKFGLTQARRDWLEAADVLDTCSISEMRSLHNGNEVKGKGTAG